MSEDVVNSTAIAVQEWIREGTLPSMHIHGTSMLPTLKNSALITIHPLKGRLKAGTMYLFLSAGRLFAHRFIAKSGGSALFAGDGNAYPERIPQTSIVGEIHINEASVRKLSFVVINLFTLFCFGWLGKPAIGLRVRLLGFLRKHSRNIKGE